MTSPPPRQGHLSPSWRRRQWLKVIVWIEDRPVPTLGGLALLLAFGLFYAFQLDGLGHFRESFARWRVENFGGVHSVDRSVRSPDVILSFTPRSSDRLDILSLVSLHFSGTAFRADLEAFARRGGKARIVTLDPRLTDSDHPNHALFLALGEAFGQDPLSFGARCWYTASVVLGLEEALGDSFDIRFIDGPIEGARAPYFCLGRSTHAYASNGSTERMDLLLPRPEEPTQLDSFADPQWIILDRPHDPRVVQFTEAFAKAWQAGHPLDATLGQQIREHLQ